MTEWAWVGGTAVSSDGDIRRIGSAVELAIWYTSLPAAVPVWTWEGGGEELLALAEARPFERWTGRIGQGTLLSLRARGGPEVRDASSLLPWLELTGKGNNADRAAELVLAVRAGINDLEGRGYAVTGKTGPRLTVGAVAWATACEVCGVDPSESLGWGDYDAGRRAYFGGRCEVGRVTADAVEGYDISGAYPWALLQPVPVGERRVSVGTAARQAYERQAPGCYWARIVQPDDLIPRLPYRHQPATGRGRCRGPLLWVTGHVEGWYVAHELAAAEDAGADVEVGIAMVWGAEEPIWAPYVEHTSRDRAQLRARGVDESSAKLLANTLSGKLAQAPEATTVRVLAEGEPYQLGWSWHGGRVWSKAHRHVPNCARPIEAAVVTARVRVELLRQMLAARSSWVYCDTDSLWVLTGTPAPSTDVAPWRLIARGREWQAPRPKTYRYQDEGGEVVTRASGVPVGLHETLRAFAVGRPSLGAVHPHLPPLPTPGDEKWAGLRRVLNDGERTGPFHRDREGKLT